MSPEETIYFAAILFVGIPASFRIWPIRVRNTTALAMVVMWFLGRAIYTLTGEGMPVNAMLIQDSAVMACMFAKEDWQDCRPYGSLRRQLACLWHERTPWDKAILILFPNAWLFYFPVTTPANQFWTLWGIGLAQLALAGLEAVHEGRQAKANSSQADAPDKFSGYFFAPVLWRLDA